MRLEICWREGTLAREKGDLREKRQKEGTGARYMVKSRHEKKDRLWLGYSRGYPAHLVEDGFEEFTPHQ